MQLPQFQTAKAVSVYIPMNREVSTWPILHFLLNPVNEKKCFVPTFTSGQPMRMLRVYSIDDIKTLDVDKWGIRQPKYFDKEREDGSVQLSSPRMKLFTSSASDVWVLLNLFYCTGLIFTYRIADRSY